MKLHLSAAQSNLAGHVNIDVTKHQIDLGNLDNICEAAECTSLIVNDLLKLVAHEQLPLVIQHLISRLRHKSKIVVIFTDINSIIREFNIGNVDEKLLNTLLFGQGGKSCFSYDYIVRLLTAAELKIVNIDINKEQVIIVAERS